jgi:hypothetical protein
MSMLFSWTPLEFNDLKPNFSTDIALGLCKKRLEYAVNINSNNLEDFKKFSLENAPRLP